MCFINPIKKIVSGFGLTMLLTVGLLAASAPASAHETDCPYCKLKVVQDTKDVDNEVVLRLGIKRIEYRCVMCAVAEAKTKYKSKDLTILAPSNVKGKPVTITKKAGEWTFAPATAAFVFAKGSHTECQDRYRALLDKGDYSAYVAKKGYKDAKQLTLKELVEQSK